MSLRDTESGRRTNPSEGAWRKPCEAFRDVLPLLHDHELGPAEAAELEMHLGECPTCQARADTYERLSSVLKRWDAEEEHPPIPNLRMQHAVLARVAQHGAQRRAADRTVRLVRFATAACVVLALSVAIVLGLTIHDREDAGAARTARAYEATDWPAGQALAAMTDDSRDLEPLVDPADARGKPSVSHWMDRRLPPLSPPKPWVDLPPLSGKSVKQLARLDHMRLRVQDFERQIGDEATIWFGIDGQGVHRIGRGALEYLRETGVLARLQINMRRAHTTLKTTSSAVPLVGVAPEKPRDVLSGLPGLTRVSTDLTHSMGFVRPRHGLEVGGVPRHMMSGYGLKTQEGGATWIEALDPLEAQANGQLWFAETNGFKLVVAFVKGTDKPIFIPDGQLLVRGAKDRIVAQPIWIPASKTEARFAIPCRVVQRGMRRKAPQPPVLSEWIAGPTVRSLLRRKIESSELLDVIASQVRIADPVRYEGTFASWSLADLPHAMRYSARESYADLAVRDGRRVRSEFVKEQLNGFVAEGEGARDGFLYGVEVTRISGAAGAALLTRLYFSYALESAVMKQMQHQVALGSYHRPAPRGGAYQALNLDTRGMREHTATQGSHRVRLLRQHVFADGAKRHPVYVQALDVDGTPTLVSVTSEGARETK